MAGYAAGAPLVALFAPDWVIENPVLVTLMHCCWLVPQRLFMTTYLPPIVVLPNCSKICVSACADGVTATTVATVPARNRPTAAMARSVLMRPPRACGGGWNRGSASTAEVMA